MEAKRIGTIHFWIDYDREIVYNQSTDLSYSLYSEDEDGDIVELDDLVEFCMNFAKAIGFAEVVVERAFGRR